MANTHLKVHINKLERAISRLSKEQSKMMGIVDATERTPKPGEPITIYGNRTGTLRRNYLIDRVLGVISSPPYKHAYVVLRDSQTPV